MALSELDHPIQVTSDWGRIFYFVWQNQGYQDPRGFSGFFDVTFYKAWAVFPFHHFPFFKIVTFDFEMEESRSEPTSGGDFDG